MKGQAHHTATNTLVQKLRQAVENNLQNEQFGVEQLAEMMNISRSQLHRKLKKSTGQSVNQFIREYRLQRALDLLKQGDKTVSEIAFEVGFSSHSYFTTCFTEHYGYPPGEVKYRLSGHSASDNQQAPLENKRTPLKWGNKLVVVGLVTLGMVLSFLLYKPWTGNNSNEAIANKSIAVLPFKNMSGDPEQEALCDGLTDEVIHRLSMIKSFDKVISLSSVMTFKNSDKTLTEIARQLDVDIVLQGSFKQSGNVVRITAQLIDAIQDDHLWSEDYEQPIGDIFDIQSDIAKKVAARFNAVVTPEETLRLDKKPTKNSEAYILLKKGQYIWNTTYDYKRTIEFYNKAIDLDPNLAEAYVYLAMSYLGAQHWHIGDKSIPVKDPIALAMKALAIDPELSLGHWALAHIYRIKEWDFKSAEEHFKIAMELDPQNGRFKYHYAYNLIHTGRISEAIPFAEEAVKLLPTEGGVLVELAKIHCFAGNNQQARQIVKELDLVFRDYTGANAGLLFLYLDSLDRAIYYLEKAIDVPLYNGFLAIAYTKKGQPQKAQQALARLEKMSQEQRLESVNYSIGLYYSGIGEVEKALNWLGKAFESHDTELLWLNAEPNFKSLHGHPRYQALLRKIGFPE